MSGEANSGVSITILGCGSSGGVPRLGGEDGRGNWGACDPANPRNRRRRCALLVERYGDGGATRVLIDTGPDMRQQLLDARVSALDAVLYTHDHADHTHGLDDLRQVVINVRRRVDVWADAHTRDVLLERFGYTFVQPPGSDYPPILTMNLISEAMIDGAETLRIEGDGGALDFRPFPVIHGAIMALGFRIGDVAYLPDVSEMTAAAWDAVAGLDLWIVDALRYTPHPSHANLETTLNWIDAAKPARAVITNMHIDLDYDRVEAETPAHVAPAYDGMRFQI